MGFRDSCAPLLLDPSPPFSGHLLTRDENMFTLFEGQRIDGTASTHHHTGGGGGGGEGGGGGSGSGEPGHRNHHGGGGRGGGGGGGGDRSGGSGGSGSMSSGGLHVSGSGDRSSGSGGSDYEPWQPTCESYLYPPSHSVLLRCYPHTFQSRRIPSHSPHYVPPPRFICSAFAVSCSTLSCRFPLHPMHCLILPPPPSDHECRWASTLPKVLIRLVPIRSVHTLRDGCGTETSEQFPSPRDNVYCIYYRI